MQNQINTNNISEETNSENNKNKEPEKLENRQTTGVCIIPYTNINEPSVEAQSYDININETKGKIIETSINSSEELSKGSMYLQTGSQTIYTLETNTKIIYTDYIDEISIENPIDIFQTENEQNFSVRKHNTI